MEQKLKLQNVDLIIEEPEPKIIFDCKTLEKSKHDGFLFVIKGTIIFRDDVTGVRFQFFGFDNNTDNDTRTYEVLISVNPQIFNFIASNIKSAQLIFDDKPNEKPEDKIKKMKLLF